MDMALDARSRARELLNLSRRRKLARPETDELRICLEQCERQRERDALAAARVEYDRLMVRVRQA